MSSFSSSSIQSGSDIYIKAAKQLQAKIGRGLQSPLANLTIKGIGVESIYVPPTSSPEKELCDLGRREIRQLKEAQAFDSPKQQVLNSYRKILQFISNYKKEIDFLRELHGINNGAYEEILNSCNPQQKCIVKFLTNTDKAVSYCYAEGLEEALGDALEEDETSQQFEAASSNKQWGQPSDFSNSFSTSWNTPSYSHYGQSFSFGFGDGIGYTVSGFPDTGCGMPSVETKESVHPDLSEEASAAVAKDKMGSSSTASYEIVSDENRKSEAPLRAQQRSGPITHSFLLSSLPFDEKRIEKSFEAISWARPEDRVQMLVIFISMYELNEAESFYLMKKLKEFESKEKEFMTDEEKQNVQFNDYYGKIKYREGKPFLIAGQQLPGAVSDLRWTEIHNYSQFKDGHRNKTMTEDFLARVRVDIQERAKQPRIVEIREKIMNFYKPKANE